MIRTTLTCLMLACTAASSVMGADFDFAARVDVLPSISVSDADFPGSTTETPTLPQADLQDRCPAGQEGLEVPRVHLEVVGMVSMDYDAADPSGDAVLRINVN